ncbi:unnamed protein product [Arctia plantaginis]|uniref:Uncharacterized protein n=1 Tax=Arctia plantaginis TaxID=874455 RepID=A0A8S0YL73_ARCPL|nr:unnamed protein product [Arctia plantaginis]
MPLSVCARVSLPRSSGPVTYRCEWLKQNGPILMRNYSKSGNKWTEAVVKERTGPVSYKRYNKRDGHMYKRHIDQILARKPRHSLSQIVDSSHVKSTAGLTTKSDEEEYKESFDSAEEGAGTSPTIAGAAVVF